MLDLLSEMEVRWVGIEVAGVKGLGVESQANRSHCNIPVQPFLPSLSIPTEKKRLIMHCMYLSYFHKLSHISSIPPNVTLRAAIGVRHFYVSS